MSHPIFLHVYSTGDIWVGNEAIVDPKVKGSATGTLVTVVRFNSDCTLQKVATLTGSGNSSATALACTAGTGVGADRFKVKELT